MRLPRAWFRLRWPVVAENVLRLLGGFFVVLGFLFMGAGLVQLWVTVTLTMFVAVLGVVAFVLSALHYTEPNPTYLSYENRQRLISHMRAVRSQWQRPS